MTGGAPTIVTLGAGDIGELLAVERQSYARPWTESMFRAELGHDDAICLGARAADSGAAGEGHRLVGFLIASRLADAVHVMDVAVRPAWRRRGIARRLLDELFVRAGRPVGGVVDGSGSPGATVDAGGYTLEVRTSNTAAINLYRHAGFREHGVRRGYYADTGEDALIMWRAPQVLMSAEAVAAGHADAWRPAL